MLRRLSLAAVVCLICIFSLVHCEGDGYKFVDDEGREIETVEEGNSEQADATDPSNGCSSNSNVDKPCGMTNSYQGFFEFAKDVRKYTWLYNGICLAFGCCIFIFVVSAAIYQAKTAKHKRVKLLQQIHEEDERALQATVHMKHIPTEVKPLN